MRENDLYHESDRSLVLNVIAGLFILLLVVILVPTSAAAHGYGNDGNLCHGHNMASCRPDPQPSHGHDCDSHGRNTDGNDDHCGPTATVTPCPSCVPATQAPPPTGSLVPPIETANPIPPPPATDTTNATPVAVGTPPNTVVFFLFAAAGLLFIAAKLLGGRYDK